MRCFCVEAVVKRMPEDTVRDDILDKASKTVIGEYGKNYIFVERMRQAPQNWIFSLGVFDFINPESLVKQFFCSLNLTYKIQNIKEITFKNILNMLSHAENEDFIKDMDEVLIHYSYESLHTGYHRIYYEETMIEQNNKTNILRECKKLLFPVHVLEELDRIYAAKNDKKLAGHPVHYMIESDDKIFTDTAIDAIVGSLYSQNRIHNKRVCEVENIYSNYDFSMNNMDSLFNVNIGGVVLLTIKMEDDNDKQYANAGVNVIDKLCDIIKKYQNKVLTIIRLPSECTKVKQMFEDRLIGMTFVELKDQCADYKNSCKYLRNMATEYSVDVDKRLLDKLDKTKFYHSSDLKQYFDEWYGDRLKDTVFPQYSSLLSTREKIVKGHPKGSSYDELMEMVGLSEAKRIIQNALNYYKAQKLYSNMGMTNNKPSMHMVFTGNPGTAKTTVARLFADILKENNVLSTGVMVEVGRGDLVGKYVGWTAPTIKKKFQEAKGGVLFIDEAYSLVDDRDGSFGDEAINTIVQEMENNRESVIVIFAGYPDKMERFLDKNPGLRSRIAFHINFDDYNIDELCEITQLMATKKNLCIAEEAMDKLRELFSVASLSKDFGNGRYVRNLIELALMQQSTRIINMNQDEITKATIATLIADDFVEPESSKKVKKSFGFISDAC